MGAVSDTYRREVGIPFRLDSNPNLRDSMGVGTDIGVYRSSGGTARRGRAVPVPRGAAARRHSDLARRLLGAFCVVETQVDARMEPSERLLRLRCWRGPTGG